MALIVETGAGVALADAYVALATVDAYWLSRSHTAFSAAWAAEADVAKKEGAIREATQHLDALYGAHYKGQRAGYVQGLMWPRSGALDEAGYDLPDLPPELASAACELAGRSISGRLVEDTSNEGQIIKRREKLGPLDEETHYAEATGAAKKFGAVDGIVASILDGTQTGAPIQWNWR